MATYMLCWEQKWGNMRSELNNTNNNNNKVRTKKIQTHTAEKISAYLPNKVFGEDLWLAPLWISKYIKEVFDWVRHQMVRKKARHMMDELLNYLQSNWDWILLHEHSCCFCFPSDKWLSDLCCVVFTPTRFFNLSDTTWVRSFSKTSRSHIDQSTCSHSRAMNI